MKNKIYLATMTMRFRHPALLRPAGGSFAPVAVVSARQMLAARYPAPCRMMSNTTGAGYTRYTMPALSPSFAGYAMSARYVVARNGMMRGLGLGMMLRLRLSAQAQRQQRHRHCSQGNLQPFQRHGYSPSIDQLREVTLNRYYAEGK